MEEVVISLGGSIVNPGEIDVDFLLKFISLIKSFSKKYKFIIVLGGGFTARQYIKALKGAKLSDKIASLFGINITRLNARLLMTMYSKSFEHKLPKSIKDVENVLKKNNIAFCGALRYEPENTSDGTAAKLASYFKCNFINMTNVKGLFTKDPRKNKDAKFISKITSKELNERASKLKYKPGQHFVIDQSAAALIEKNKIQTFIVGSDLNNLERLLSGRSFVGTVVY
ncbi:UMP kinase [Candidatus Woesearchaeota archaeon]|nr:UMP kinase [Candidatus Woesearchaeota archaeon]